MKLNVIFFFKIFFIHIEIIRKLRITKLHKSFFLKQIYNKISKISKIFFPFKN